VGHRGARIERGERILKIGFAPGEPRPLARRLLAIGWLVGSVLGGPAVAQDALNESQRIQEQLNREGQRIQERIDALDDQARELLETYRSISAEADRAEAYNQRLSQEIEAQEARKQRLEQQIARIEETREAIRPFMEEMVATLESLIERDLPFRRAERLERVASARRLLVEPGATPAEKFRAILEVYQKEMDYGRTIDAYRDEITRDGETQTVDLLRIGRLTLFYRTLDGQEQGLWDPEQASWVSLDDRYAGAIETGLRVAREQTAPHMLRLPVPAPTAGESP
jgi:hypothetical protein